MSKVCKLCGYDCEELIKEIKNLKSEKFELILKYDEFILKNSFKFQNCMEISKAELFEENEILLKALQLACKTLNAVCMTQNYTLGLGQNETYFFKKAKETLKND